MTKYTLIESKYTVVGRKLGRALMALTRYRLKEPISEDDMICVRDTATYLEGATHSFEKLEGKSLGDKFLLIGDEVPTEEVEADLAISRAFGSNDVFRKKEVSGCADVLKSLCEGKKPPIEKVEGAANFALGLLDYMNQAEGTLL